MAMLVTWLAQLLGVVSVVAVPSVERQVPDRQSLEALAILGAAFAGTVVLLCVQAFTEELGWRGYFLPRMMQSLGPWRGLLIHGLVWGTWYAPVVALAAEGSASAAIRGGTFVVTCTLLGILLGWLRLLARSLSLAVVFNAVLTVSAGLPFILRGVDVGSRGSAYGPAGWIPLLLAAAVLFSGPARRAVTTPRAVDAHPRGPGSVRRFVESLISRNGHHTR
jgi:membrane protease YdiL (CAAX protease family)